MTAVEVVSYRRLYAARGNVYRYSRADEEAFHNAIQSEPNNNLHRLVYADYLDEQGSHDRAVLNRGWANGLHQSPRSASAADRRRVGEAGEFRRALRTTGWLTPEQREAVAPLLVMAMHGSARTHGVDRETGTFRRMGVGDADVALRAVADLLNGDHPAIPALREMAESARGSPDRRSGYIHVEPSPDRENWVVGLGGGQTYPGSHPHWVDALLHGIAVRGGRGLPRMSMMTENGVLFPDYA